MKIIAGLGNPGATYTFTRHNIGFMVIDELVSRFSLDKSDKFNSHFYKMSFDGEQVFLLKPQTFMNLSGKAILACKAFYKVDSDNIFVFHDDIDLKLGKVAFKKGGGAGGHNGLKSIDSLMGKEYHRIRIGVGRPIHEGQDVANFVLNSFTTDEKTIVRNIIETLNDNLGIVFNKDITALAGLTKKILEIS